VRTQNWYKCCLCGYSELIPCWYVDIPWEVSPVAVVWDRWFVEKYPNFVSWIFFIEELVMLLLSEMNECLSILYSDWLFLYAGCSCALQSDLGLISLSFPFWHPIGIFRFMEAWESVPELISPPWTGLPEGTDLWAGGRLRFLRYSSRAIVYGRILAIANGLKNIIRYKSSNSPNVISIFGQSNED
jgi:hypothetical protein